MLRWLTRLLLLVYLSLPIVVALLLFTTVRQIQADVEPVITTAATRINSAVSALDNELRDMGSNFQPLVDSVNAVRSGLNTVGSFVSGAVNTTIDAVNSLTFNAFRIPRFSGITIPPLINLDFITRISQNVTQIGTQVNAVATVVTDTVSARLQSLVLAVTLLIVWVVLGFVLMWLPLYLTLWRGR